MIKGFSRLTKQEKIDYLVKNHLDNRALDFIESLNINNAELEALIEGFSENVISNYIFPYSIAPNFLINGKNYMVPMVTEESSVVAAAAKSAAYWFSRGGFRTKILGTTKNGQVHLKYKGAVEILKRKFEEWKPQLLNAVEQINSKMKNRGGGIQELGLVDKTQQIENYFQVDVSFETCNAMGANYMNSCLEGIGEMLKLLFDEDTEMRYCNLDVVMAILSNYSPENAVHVKLQCPVTQLGDGKMKMHPSEFAKKMCEAVEIANVDISRAVTHNKGMYNGIDAVALATGNDWRAIEANGHAYASKDGVYRSLSTAEIVSGEFIFEATIPMQVGTVGGITGLHPLAKLSKKILDKPSAEDLMKIMASVGLASNFGAVKSLVTTGIQKGHMKMHLSNILVELKTTQTEKSQAMRHFSNRTVTHSDVINYIIEVRKK